MTVNLVPMQKMNLREKTKNGKDQERLANYLINKCKAKWMMIIKNTDFIFDLYNNKGLNVQSFEKTYLVSFMNRNNRETEHLIIKNY
jgi:DNA adenine methylase